MGSTPEGLIKKRIIKFLKTVQGFWFYCAQDRFTSGIPDIVGCLNGRFIAFEVKALDGKASKLQLVVHRKIREAQGSVYLVTSVDQVKQIVNDFYE